MFFFNKRASLPLRLMNIDFKGPWWHLITDQKWLFARITILTSLSYLFWNVMPFIIGYLFEHASAIGCVIFFVVWLLIDYAHTYGRRLNARFQLQCIHSLYDSAHQFFLTVDPRFHMHRSSGAVLGKIDRAARGYEEILDQITYEFVPLVLGLLAMIIALSYYSLILAVGTLIFFIVMLLFAYYFARFWCHRWEKQFIATDDAYREVAVENLAQVHHVRASFASNYMRNKLRTKIVENMESEGKLWRSYTLASFVLNVLHACSVLMLILFLAYQVQHGATTAVSAIGLTVAYIQCTHYLTMIIKPFRRYMRGWAAVKDLFEFIPYFGQQTYPVLGFDSSVLIEKRKPLSIIVDNMTFDYGTGELFSGHTFSLICSENQTSMLYGVIGESGKGKTTFIQILGGQLKPFSGTVRINNIDIYGVDDAIRTQLIALQGQVATTVRGTVRYNLLFGLPEHHAFDDSQLYMILEKVGLLEVFNTYNGLDTMLGEGGLNISGGQRQRLNFAALYVRAQHYRPLLILIDEPTSSLDELSERAITEMIEDLSKIAITLVIAHRLKTLDKAVGLIDLSLLDTQKQIAVYTAQELQEQSSYYAQLIEGSQALETFDEEDV